MQNQLTRLVNAYNSNMPFVCYKEPEANVVKVFIGQSLEIHPTTLNLELKDQSSGFIFMPFKQDVKGYYLPFNEAEEIEISLNINREILNTVTLKEDVIEKTVYIQKIKNCLDYLKTSDTQKVVFTRRKSHIISTLDLKLIFQSLFEISTTNFQYIWFHPNTNLWVGSTPETLCSQDSEGYYTMALAGTNLYKEALVWQSKEIKEQAFVTQEIVAKLKTKKVPVKLGETTTLKTGRLAHIKTDIFVEAQPGFSIFDMALLLHPTPAVCGLPTQEAKAYLLAHEAYTREFYTGFLGVHTPAKSKFYVNLRCMQLKTNEALLYAGGGITIDSNPDMEWTETCIKLQSMMQVIATHLKN